MKRLTSVVMCFYILVLRVQAWEPPIGIPRPDFGIEETYRMYDDPANRNPNLVYQTSAYGGYFTHYVDMNDPLAADDNNPYGSIAKPRLTIPWINSRTAPGLPAGSVVEIHNGVYESAGTYVYLICNGTQDKPVFIRGPDSEHMAVIREQIRMHGSYAILENLEWDGNWTNVGLYFRFTLDWDIDEVVAHHMAVRSSKFHHLLGSAIRVYQNTHDIVAYNNEAYQIKAYANYDWNDPQQADGHGMCVGCHDLYRLEDGVYVEYKVQGVTPFENYWCVDNYFHEFSGDGFHALTFPEGIPKYPGGPKFGLYAQYMYVGRNVFGPGKENGIDIKHGHDVILSQNTLFGFTVKPSPSDSPGEAICLNVQGYSNNWWVLYNNISDCVLGISGYQTPTPAYIIGNVIHDLHHDPIRGIIATGISGGATGPIINNVIYNVEIGINDKDEWGDDAPIINNIVSNCSSYHVYSRITGYNNLLWQNEAPVVINGGGTNINGITADPQFADSANNNFNLKDTSPAIDAGTSAGVVKTVFDTFEQLYGIDIRKDIEGGVRPYGAEWDIGAYEWGSTPADPNQEPEPDPEPEQEAEPEALIPDVTALLVMNNIIKSGGNQSASIRCDMKEQGKLIVKIYDAKGKEIITVCDEQREEGRHEFVWSGQDSTGRTVGSGIYIVQMHAEAYKETKKIAVIK